MLNEINYVLFGNWKRYFLDTPTPQLSVALCLTKTLTHTPLNRGKNNKNLIESVFMYIWPVFVGWKRGSKFSRLERISNLIWAPKKLVFMILYLEFSVLLHSAKLRKMACKRIERTSHPFVKNITLTET